MPPLGAIDLPELHRRGAATASEQQVEDYMATGERPGIRIGWIGTGRMGAAMVSRLLEAGADVAVYNRTLAKAEALAGAGATVVDRPVDLAGRDVVFTMVSGPADLLDVTCGEGGVLTGESAPGVLVDSSTISAEVSAQVRAAAAAVGTAFLAAPVSGNPKVVRSGRLTFAVSGSEEAYRAVEPLLRHLGRGSPTSAMMRWPGW
jgi:3-hydroxyisobutyrate dehydrogenase